MEEQMRNIPTVLITLALSSAAILGFTARSASAAEEPVRQEKEWTMLVFLNGHNNLDSFGAKDINEMEKVGSSDQVNVVVQWASMKNQDTRRLLVQKDSDPTKVTSPTVQSLPRVDMGNPNNLVEFIRWAAENYPAKRYFVDVWDHGSGWHLLSDGITTRDISWDDYTHNSITTEELGVAMREISRVIGKKVSLYGSDACLMAMAEVGSEMAEAAEVMVGSEDLEPGDGWAYEGILSRLVARPEASGRELGAMVVEAYIQSYSGGSQGTSDVTQSAFDLTRTSELHAAVASLGAQLRGLEKTDRAKVVKSINDALNFYYSDYVDLGDFLGFLSQSRIPSIDSTVVDGARRALQGYVVANGATGRFRAAQGVSIWAPTYKSTFNRYSSRYRGLTFHKETAWGDTLQHILQDLQ
jgi:hypothetical protein